MIMWKMSHDVVFAHESMWSSISVDRRGKAAVKAGIMEIPCIYTLILYSLQRHTSHSGFVFSLGKGRGRGKGDIFGICSRGVHVLRLLMAGCEISLKGFCGPFTLIFKRSLE